MIYLCSANDTADRQCLPAPPASLFLSLMLPHKGQPFPSERRNCSHTFRGMLQFRLSSAPQRYNTLDVAGQNRVPTGMLRAPIGNPAAKRCSLCNPSFPSQVHIQTAKGSLSSLLRKCKRRSVPMRDRLPFLRQPQFYHRTRNDKVKIDGDAIRGYTVIASLNSI